MYDIIIVGAGPAGMTAAIYGSRAGKKVLVLEKKACGGQIINATKVKNYPGFLEISGLELSKNMRKQVESLGAEIKFEEVEKIVKGDKFKVKTDEGEYQARAIILATGAESGRLGLPNEEKLTGRGVSYCATCDGHFYKDKNVAVIGGGNTALYDALYLSDIAKKVYLIHRRDEFRAEKALVLQAEKKGNVEFVLGANITGFLSKDSMLTGVKLEKYGSEVLDLEISGVFVAIGYVPQNQVFSNVVLLDDKGYIETSDGVHTSTSKIYVAGDARKKDLKQLTTAVSDGAIAASMAVKELD